MACFPHNNAIEKTIFLGQKSKFGNFYVTFYSHTQKPILFLSEYSHEEYSKTDIFTIMSKRKLVMMRYLMLRKILYFRCRVNFDACF